MNAVNNGFVQTAQQPPEPDLDLTWILRILWRRKLLIASFCVLGLAFAKLFLVITPPTYVTSAVLVLEVQTRGVFRPNSVFSGQLINQAVVESQVEVLRSEQIISQVIAQLKLLDDPDFQPKQSPLFGSPTSDAQAPLITASEELKRRVSVERIGESNAIRISASGDDPIKAALIANTIAQTFIRDQLAQPPSGDLTKIPLEDRIIVTRAVPPTRPTSPRKLLVYGGALLLSLMAAVIAVMFRQWSDDRIQTIGDLKNSVHAPCLATLPNLRGVKATIEPNVKVGEAQHFSTKVLDMTERGRNGQVFADAARRLALPVQEARGGAHDRMVLGITSMTRGEGASTVTLTMAALLSRLSGPTLLIDCDFSGSGLSSGLGKDLRGLSDVLEGRCSADAVYWSSETDAMTFLPPGASPVGGHSADLLGSYQMAEFLQDTARHFKYVLLDIPPLLTSIDARAASSSIDSFIIVAEWKRTRRRDIYKGLEVSGPVQAKLIGAVLNKCNMSKMAKSD